MIPADPPGSWPIQHRLQFLKDPLLAMPTISEYLFEVFLAKARITNNFRIAIISSTLIKFFNYLRKLKVTLTKIAYQKLPTKNT